MPHGEEHPPRKQYPPTEGDHYRPRDPFFGSHAGAGAREAVEAFYDSAYGAIRAAQAGPGEPPSPPPCLYWGSLSDAAFLRVCGVTP